MKTKINCLGNLKHMKNFTQIVCLCFELHQLTLSSDLHIRNMFIFEFGEGKSSSFKSNFNLPVVRKLIFNTFFSFENISTMFNMMIAFYL